MAERALRGSRLGAQSYETDAGVEMAPRQSITYNCPDGHRFASDRGAAQYDESRSAEVADRAASGPS